MKALLTATFSFSLKSQQVFLFFLWQLFLTECHAEYQVVKNKKMCACFPGQGIKGPYEERKSFCGKTLDTLNVLHLPKLELLFFLNLILHLGILNIRHLGQNTQCLPPAVILLCWWEKSETETRKPCVRKKNLSKHPEKTSHVYFMFVKLYVTCVISELLWQWPILFPLVVQVIYIWSSLPFL